MNGRAESLAGPAECSSPTTTGVSDDGGGKEVGGPSARCAESRGGAAECSQLTPTGVIDDGGVGEELKG